MPRRLARVRLLAEQAAYFAAESAAGFRRNGLMTVAAVTTIIVALMVVGTALLLGLNVSHLATTLEAQVEVVAFLRDGLTPSELMRTQQAIAGLPGVTAVRYVSRTEALARLRQRLGDAAAFDDPETAKLLPDSVEVSLADAGSTKGVAASIARTAGVEEVTYGAQVTDRLLALTRGVRIVAGLLTLFLTAVALIVVVNTIRLTVIARQREIEIMQLVGATRWFIQWPLLLEGALEGVAAAAVATLALGAVYGVGANRLSAALPFLPLVPVSGALLAAAIGVAVTGLVVGAAGSLIAVRRFVTL